jgi:YegS/Rv2252/BmrU family lipid kinase
VNLQASIVYNSVAQRRPTLARVHGAALKWRAAGWDIDVRVTECTGHATVLAREAAASGAKVVFACGGDGTVNEVVNGLVGSDSSLAVIRGGTSNVFASEIGVPWPLEKALGVLVHGDVRRFDLGMAGGRYFLMMAGIGFDASAVRHVSDRVKRSVGVGAYYLSSVLELARYRSHRVNLRFDATTEREENLYWLVLGNTRSYAGIIDITSRALADDGYLDAYRFGHRVLPWMIANFLLFALRRGNWARGVTFQRLRELEISTPGVPVHVDGEYLGETPMVFRIAPQALSVLLPKGRALPMLGKPASLT